MMIGSKIKGKSVQKRKRENLVQKRKQVNETKKLRKRQLINYLRTELRTSTTHGLPYIANEDIHWFERIFWFISFLMCATLAGFFLSAQYHRFIETPNVMSVEMDYFNWNVSYPAFTLCPTIKSTYDSLISTLNGTQLNTEIDVNSHLFAISSVSLDTLDMLNMMPENVDVNEIINPKDYARIAAGAFGKFVDESITTNTNWPISVHAVMTELGMCHVINSNVGIFDNPMNWKKGARSKYRKTNIDISFYERDFFTQIMNYANVYKIFIHSPDEIPLITTPSYTHSVTGYLLFGVKVSSIRISENFRHSSISMRKCRFINEPISKRYPVYSYNHCLLECRIQMIKKLCGCVPHFYKPLDDEKICDIYELKCVNDYRREIVTLSTKDDTRKKFKDNRHLPKNHRDCNCLSSCEIDIYHKDNENFVPDFEVNKMKIGISSFPKFRIVRDIIFSFEDIILRVGGVVNLCIGTSIISFAEYFVSLLRITVFSLQKMWDRKP